MSTKYVFDSEAIATVARLNKEMHDMLKTSFGKSKALVEFMQTTDLWEGQRKEEFTAYLHLVAQYHGWLVGESVPSAGKVAAIQPEINCCEKIQAAWSALIKAMGDFSANSAPCKAVEDIK